MRRPKSLGGTSTFVMICLAEQAQCRFDESLGQAVTTVVVVVIARSPKE